MSINTTLRKVLLPIFSKVNLGNIRITHHYTGDKILIHSFKHKGYWYTGKKREYCTMLSFEKLLRKGETVIEIGGHIGYISLWFSRLVGKDGHVHVFEPGTNNLPYIRHNISHKSNVSLVEKGAGSKRETLIFYMDSLTGQNNSFIKDHDAFITTRESNNLQMEMQVTEVSVIPVDEYIEENKMKHVSLIKIDVENYECEVIKGLINTMKNIRPIFMIEVAPENRAWIYNIMNEFDYIPYSSSLEKISKPLYGNIFFIPIGTL